MEKSMHPLVHHFHRVIRQLSAFHTIPLIPLLLAAFWLLILYRGERSTFKTTISTCDWSQWETWPSDAQPHRAILVADPQLVDPHTYPGRPWPLSSLTERYTDRYMARSYRMINERHDPDSIIFLGDMFDGGREWAPSRARPLTKVQEWQLEKAAPASTDVPEDAVRVDIEDPGWRRPGELYNSKSGALERRQDDDGRAAAPLDLKAFVYGEHGRWQAYGDKQWESEYKRFGDIFLEHDQLYPNSERTLQPLMPKLPDFTNVENGAKDRPKQQFALVGAKTRTVLASLPGNHDLGFGSGIQMPVRARYKWHFGDLSRLDILGNHTVVSIDAVSLAAWSQYESDGHETTAKDALSRKHIYAPAQQFVDSVPRLSRVATQGLLSKLYPGQRKPVDQKKLLHLVEDITAANASSASGEEVKRSISDSGHAFPVILLSHVPLYREPDTSCGPQRERGHALTLTGGYQYQNVLTNTLSQTLVDKLQAAGELRHIFSGDDHDYCDITHTYPATSQLQRPSAGVREETVKSFSWAMGVRKPGFQMVSLWNPVSAEGQSLNTDGDTIHTHLCFLPDQLGIFIHYATMAVLTVLLLFIRAVILALRIHSGDESDNDVEAIVPMLQKLNPLRLTSMNGNSSPSKTISKHRHRASSSGLKPLSNGHLGVQRSANARARSVSPGVGLLQSGSSPFSTPSKPLIDQAGYHGAGTSDDDEEAKIGETGFLSVDDSQAKWRRRRRPRGRLQRALDELVLGLSLVAGAAVPFYLWLIYHG